VGANVNTFQEPVYPSAAPITPSIPDIWPPRDPKQPDESGLAGGWLTESKQPSIHN
jgi:hypothetical protein